MAKKKGFRIETKTKYFRKKQSGDKESCGESREADGNPVLVQGNDHMDVNDMSAAERLVRAFAEQLGNLKESLGEHETILLALGQNSKPRGIQKVDLRVSGPDVISASIVWLEGDTEQRVFTTQTFQPVLSRKSGNPLPNETMRLLEQLLGHITAHGVLCAQMLASAAQNSGDAVAFLDAERSRALGVVKGANISAGNINGEEIRTKAITVVNQTFDSIQVDNEKAFRTLN